MKTLSFKRIIQSIQGKVIAAIAVACVTLWMSVEVSRTVFREMLDTVKEVTSPDRNLNLINTVFREVIQLQQRQREVILHRDVRSKQALLAESRRLTQALDTLLDYIKPDTVQMQRVEAMKRLLKKRGGLFNQYLTLRAEVLDSRTLARQMDSLSYLISQEPVMDTLVVPGKTEIVTLESPVTVDSAAAEEPKAKAPFLQRLFSRKKHQTPIYRQQVIRELLVRTDTLNIAQQQAAIREMKYFIDSIKQVHIKRNAKFVNQELDLMYAANQIMNELFDLLHEIEKNELVVVGSNSARASASVTLGLGQLKLIIAFFLVATAALAVFIFFDITKSHRYRVQLQAAKDEAEHLGNVKQRFLANMSHELRTPLQSIVGFAEQVRSQASPDRAMLEAIYQSSDHLLHIVNEALDYSRIVAGKFVFEHKPFHFAEVLGEVAEVMRLQAAAKGLVLNFQSDVARGTVVVGDAFRLRQILYNIIGNAIKFTAQGTVSFCVTHDAQDERKYIFTVIDTGVGISDTDVDRIFNVFEQAGDHFSRGGTGLGLSITRELVENQGGTIAVDSTPGIGSKFTVTLSFNAAAANHRVMPPSGADLLQLGGKVVVIDDDPYICQLCAFILAKYGVEHVVYYSAIEFLKQPWDLSIRLLLVDIRMPGMSGLELCQAVRQSPEGRHTPILAVTAQTLPEEHREIMESGFEAILVKPFKEGDLMAALQTLSATRASFNLSTVARMSGGDQELFYANLDIFVEETKRDLELLNECVVMGHALQAAEIVHRLAGRVGQVYAKDLAARLRKLEHQLRGGAKIENVKADLGACCAGVDTLVGEIGKYAGAGPRSTVHGPQ
jgi:signal transduction histidine kinase/DNA-binding response OmpR family regulator